MSDISDDASDELRVMGYPLTVKSFNILTYDTRGVLVEINAAIRLAKSLKKLSANEIVNRADTLLSKRPFISGYQYGACDVVMYEEIMQSYHDIPTIRWSSRGHKHSNIRRWMTLLTTTSLIVDVGSSKASKSLISSVDTGSTLSYVNYFKSFRINDANTSGYPTITVLSYNSLSSNAFIRYESQDKVRDKKIMHERIKSLIRMVFSFSADVVLLSEIDSVDYTTYWKQALNSHGYSSIHCSRPKFHGNNNPDGLLLLWKKSVLKKRYLDKVRLDDYSRASIACELVDDPTRNVSLVCCFTHIESGLPVIVAGSHLYWKPKCSTYKLFHSAITRQLMQSAAFREQSNHFIYCGDFNIRAGSDEYDKLIKGTSLQLSCKSEITVVKGDRHELHCCPVGDSALQFKMLINQNQLKWENITIQVKEQIHNSAIKSIAFDVKDGVVEVPFTGSGQNINITEDIRSNFQSTEIKIKLHPMMHHDLSEYVRHIEVEYSFKKEKIIPLKSAYSSYSKHFSQVPEHLIRSTKEKYPEVNYNTLEPHFTNINDRADPPFCGTLDYILHSSDLRVRSLAELPDYETIQSRGMPNEISIPSDHLPLWAEFELISPSRQSCD